jgi:hypothetical protein
MPQPQASSLVENFRLTGEVYPNYRNSQVIPYIETSSVVFSLSPKLSPVLLYCNSCKNRSCDLWHCWMQASLCSIASQFMIQKSEKCGQIHCFIECVRPNELFLSKVLLVLSKEMCTVPNRRGSKDTVYRCCPHFFSFCGIYQPLAFNVMVPTVLESPHLSPVLA